MNKSIAFEDRLATREFELALSERFSVEIGPNGDRATLRISGPIVDIGNSLAEMERRVTESYGIDAARSLVDAVEKSLDRSMLIAAIETNRFY